MNNASSPSSPSCSMTATAAAIIAPVAGISVGRYCLRTSRARSSRDFLAAIDVDHVAGNPVRAGVRQRHKRAAQIRGCREPVMRISQRGDLDEFLVAGDLA